MEDTSEEDLQQSRTPLLAGILSHRKAHASYLQEDQHPTRSILVIRFRQTWHVLGRVCSHPIFHKFVLVFVVLDTLLVIAQLLLNLFICELESPPEKEFEKVHRLNIALKVVTETSFVLSCVFMAELLATLLGFGWRYLEEWIHLLDAFVITAGFILDLLLKGPLEEAAALLVVLRLWRIVKIAEEVVVEAYSESSEIIASMNIKMEDLEMQNAQLRARLGQ